MKLAADFGQKQIDELADTLKEPSWMRKLRHKSLDRFNELHWPHKSDDIWRRTDVSLLDPTKGFRIAESCLSQSVHLSDDELASRMQPLGDELLITYLNGERLSDNPLPDGISVKNLGEVSHKEPEFLKDILQIKSFTETEQKLASLNAAFSGSGIFLRVADNYQASRVIRLIRIFQAGPKQAIFPTAIIHVKEGASITLIDETISYSEKGVEDPHIINGRIEILLEPQAHLKYVRLQRLSANAREFLLLKANLKKASGLSMSNISMGSQLSKAHIISRFEGEGASSRILGFAFGKDKQHIDQHTLQDHCAAQTTSDLKFRAALRDESRMVFTGLIRIAKNAERTDAYQANNNLILSESARAESIPMLEILADDVQAKHGVSVGPVDEDQRFYLMSRGIPEKTAERLIVMGFVEPIIEQVPFEPLKKQLREEIEGNLYDQADGQEDW